MPKLAPTFQCRVLKQAKRRGSYLFLETLEGLTFLQLGGDGWLKTCAMGLEFSQCARLKHEVYFI
jgi:hypothetical protein